jgi:general stress protein 26
VSALAEIAPAFVTMAHRIVWCTVATVAPSGVPSTRVLHPIWEWDGSTLTGWVATSPESPKAAHVAANPWMSLTYWDDTHDTCTADCGVTWETSDTAREAAWQRFAKALAPVGYDPSIIPGWTSPSSPTFGVLQLQPEHLRLMPGSLMLRGEGALLSWRA